MQLVGVLFIFPIVLASGPQSQPATPPTAKKTAGRGGAGAGQPLQIGDDIVQVINKLVKAGAATEKGEFETTAEYEARRRAVPVPKAPLVLIMEDNIITYDADTAEMTARLVPDQSIPPTHLREPSHCLFGVSCERADRT